MSEVAEVWLLAVALDGEDTFWLGEPSNLKALPDDWKHVKCRWLYPVEEKMDRFADLSGFDCTDAVYEVGHGAISKVLRGATLVWNIKGKRQKVGGSTYVFVPAEDMKVMEEAYNRFLKLEAASPHPQRSAPSPSPVAEQVKPEADERDEPNDAAVGEEAETPQPAPPTNSGSLAKIEEAESGDELLVRPWQERLEAEGNADSVSSATQSQDTTQVQRRRSNHLSLNSHKRQQPHRGTTIYIAPTSAAATGDHSSSEAFDWEEMFIVHRGSVDFLCPHVTNNRYGFRLDRVMHDGMPVFLLFSSRRKNSESIDSTARGVPVFEKAKLSGEGGEGEARGSVLVLTRLGYVKHPERLQGDQVDGVRRRGRPPLHRRGRPPLRRQRSSSDDDTLTEEEEDDSDDDDDDDDDSEDSLDDDAVSNDSRPRGGRGAAARAGRPRRGNDAETSLFADHLPGRRAATARTPHVKDEMGEASGTGGEGTEQPQLPPRRRGRRPAAPKEEPPLQAVNVNFWSDPIGVVPPVSQLARDFPFTTEAADTPQTVVFGDGVCVTYTAASAAKQVPAEKKRKVPKHSNTSASIEDSDLSMLNAHILNAFAQVRKEGLEE